MANQIEVIVHPQSIVHSLRIILMMAVFSLSLDLPDMRSAISYALSHPERETALVLESLDLTKEQSDLSVHNSPKLEEI